MVSHSHDLFKRGAVRPYFGEHLLASGKGESAYFYQDLYIARKIFENAPENMWMSDHGVMVLLLI